MLSATLSTGASKSGGFEKIAGATRTRSNRSTPGGSSMLKCAASLPPSVHTMASRSCADDAENVATRDQLFSANVTASGPAIASSSTTFPTITNTSAATSLTPSLTCTVTSYVPSPSPSSGSSKSLTEPKASSPDSLNTNKAASAPPAMVQVKSAASVSLSVAARVATAIVPSSTMNGPTLVITGAAALWPNTGDAHNPTAPSNTSAPTTPARRATTTARLTTAPPENSRLQ